MDIIQIIGYGAITILIVSTIALYVHTILVDWEDDYDERRDD